MSNNENSRREFMTTTGAAAGLAAFAAAFTGSTAQGAVDVTELNAMGPTPEQTQAFMALPDQPVIMLNLLKLKDPVAYGKYAEEVGKILTKIGAELIFSGQCKMTMIGGAEWDRCGEFCNHFFSPQFDFCKASKHFRVGCVGKLVEENLLVVSAKLDGFS